MPDLALRRFSTLRNAVCLLGIRGIDTLARCVLDTVRRLTEFMNLLLDLRITADTLPMRLLLFGDAFRIFETVNRTISSIKATEAQQWFQ